MSVCNGSYHLLNSSDASWRGEDGILYMEECLDLFGCIPVSSCTEYIDLYVKPQFSEWIIICVYFLMFCVGLVGNGLVIAVVLKTSHMRTVINIFIVNLAMADFMVLLICMTPSVLADVTESWYLGDVMCKIVPFLQVSSFISSY